MTVTTEEVQFCRAPVCAQGLRLLALTTTCQEAGSAEEQGGRWATGQAQGPAAPKGRSQDQSQAQLSPQPRQQPGSGPRAPREELLSGAWGRLGLWPHRLAGSRFSGRGAGGAGR